MATEHELEILARYSTPSLKRNVLTRWGKQMHLAMTNRNAVENEKILNELYPTHSVPTVFVPLGKGPTEE